MMRFFTCGLLCCYSFALDHKYTELWTEFITELADKQHTDNGHVLSVDQFRVIVPERAPTKKLSKQMCLEYNVPGKHVFPSCMFKHEYVGCGIDHLVHLVPEAELVRWVTQKPGS